MDVIKTKRLILRELTLDDALFILELLNEPAFHKYIGDKGVRTESDAIEYLQSGPIASYTNFGYGLYHVAEKSYVYCNLWTQKAFSIFLGYA